MKSTPIIKRIKTITCHDVNNFGASLQAFALMKYLQILGNQVEIIDYKPAYLTYNLWAIGKKWKRNFILRLLFYSYVIPRRLLLKPRRRKFELFTRNKLTITSKRYYSNDDLKSDPPVADIYFAGSDQIWNTSHFNGKDPAFYLDFTPKGALKASYAASFSVSEIPAEQIGFVRSNLKGFDAISVREKSGLRILESLGIEGGVLVLDPVFLLDRKYWDQLLSLRQIEKYIFVYDQENNPLIKESAKLLAKEMSLKIYAIESLYPLFYADKKIRSAGPQEFLSLIKNCEVCLTNSFHATAFSLIFQKEFYTFKRIHEKVNSRMIDLLEIVHLNERIIDDPENIRFVEKINYQYVSSIFENKIKYSKEYIDTVLKIIK